MIQSSAHNSSYGPVSLETFYQVQQLLALALFNLGEKLFIIIKYIRIL